MVQRVVKPQTYCADRKKISASCTTSLPRDKENRWINVVLGQFLRNPKLIHLEQTYIKVLYMNLSLQTNQSHGLLCRGNYYRAANWTLSCEVKDSFQWQSATLGHGLLGHFWALRPSFSLEHWLLTCYMKGRLQGKESLWGILLTKLKVLGASTLRQTSPSSLTKQMPINVLSAKTFLSRF